MSKTKKIILSIVIVFVALIVIFSKKSVTESIKIGVIAPLTGVVADYGEEIRKGIIDIGTSTDISFVFEDDKCDPKEAVTAYKKLVEFEKVNFITGPACGSSQEAIIPLIKENNTIVFVPSASSRELYSQSGNNFFNVQYSLEDESKFIANKFNELNYKKVVLIHYKNAFSETHAKSFKESYQGEIIDIVLINETSDVSTELAKIKSQNNIDAIYSPDVSFFFASGLIKLNQLNIKIPVYSTYIAELPAVRTLVPNVYYSYPGNLIGSKGATFELSKEAGRILKDYVSKCAGSVSCVKDMIKSSGGFDEYGVINRPFILKKINGTGTVEIK